ncbi:MAG: DegT/DnrJ/EryC1/StrS aminotransferase family protein [Methanobacteriaceae archaeon]|nr:DegT/DnrJ/EryC1/StrS aminotransferase family protein [Methanobacteriaceae archaeon]
MELFFKKPSRDAREAMCQASLEIENQKKGNEYRKAAEDVLRKVTGHSHARMLCSGNAAIMAAMSIMKGPVMLPDQGGWSGFIKMAEFFGLEIVYVPTRMGVIDLRILEDYIISKNPESLFITSFAGYMAEQPVREIYELCDSNNVTLVEDASGAVGDRDKNLAWGENSHIMVASTGAPKMVNLGNGGFISTDKPEFFNRAHYILKTLKCSPVTCAGLVEEIKKTPENLHRTIAACQFLKKRIPSSLHQDKSGINVVIPVQNPKSTANSLRNLITVNGGGMITTCPRYDRVNDSAVCLEIKNLDIRCLDKDKLKFISEIVENLI